MTNTDLVAHVRRLAESYAPRTAERRAAAALFVALTTTKTTDAARRALATFSSPAVRVAAAAILDDLEATTAGRTAS